MIHVISYYPGAGGNRYYRQLTKQTWNEAGAIYDYLQEAKKYTGSDKYHLNPKWNESFLLTHVKDTQLIRQTYPNSYITAIDCELKSALCREWKANGIELYRQRNTRPDRFVHYNAVRDPGLPVCTSLAEIAALPAGVRSEVDQDYRLTVDREFGETQLLEESAEQTVAWHVDYYRNDTVVDNSAADRVISIENSTTDFAQAMQQEFERSQDHVFDSVWSQYEN